MSANQPTEHSMLVKHIAKVNALFLYNNWPKKYSRIPFFFVNSQQENFFHIICTLFSQLLWSHILRHSNYIPIMQGLSRSQIQIPHWIHRIIIFRSKINDTDFQPTISLKSERIADSPSSSAHRSPRDSALQYNGVVQQPDFLSILMNALQEFQKLNECQQMRCSITRQSKPGVCFVESKESDHTPWLLSGSNKADLA